MSRRHSDRSRALASAVPAGNATPPGSAGQPTATRPASASLSLSTRIQTLPWWLQLVSCGLVVAIGTAAWMWVSAPPIPRPDLAGADPLVVLAIDDAEVRVRMTPELAAAWGDLGLVRYAQSYGQEAVECFRRATALDERTWRWPFFAAAASSHLAPADGVTLMEEAIQRDPKAVWPRLLRAEWLVTLGRGDEARADYESLLAVSPEHARARLGLARLLLASGDADGALAALGTALDHPSTRRAGRQFAAQVAARQGKRDEAERLLTAAASLPADTPWPEDPLAAELPLRRVGKRSRIKLVSQMESAGPLRKPTRSRAASRRRIRRSICSSKGGSNSRRGTRPPPRRLSAGRWSTTHGRWRSAFNSAGPSPSKGVMPRRRTFSGSCSSASLAMARDGLNWDVA